MTKIEVGCQLRWLGKLVICTNIRTTIETMLAPANSTTLRLQNHEPSNCKYLQENFDDFEESDIITISLQCIILKEVGKNIYFIYPYYNVKKGVLNDGEQGSNSSNGQAPGAETQAVRDRDHGGESSGEQSLS